MIDIWVIVIIFIVGFGLTKWLSDRFEHRELELKPPFRGDKEDNSEKKKN